MTVAASRDGRSRAPADEGRADHEWSIPLSDIAVDDEVEHAVRDAVRSGWWSMGPRVGDFEEQFRVLCDARNALAVTNGTAALHLALLAVGCGPGDEVLLPSLNFVAGANVIVHVGATPVFCDVEGEDSLNIHPDDVAAAVGPATKAIMVMHYGGHPCRMDAILEIAARHGLAVIEDAAHAPGASWRGRMCGTLGDIGCFSFFSNKNMTIGEGGMVVTNDDQLAERVRLLRSHGMTSVTWERHRADVKDYDVVVEGLNYRLDDLRAAIGVVESRRLRERNAARAMLVARYRAELDGVRGMRMPFRPRPEADPAHHLAVILLPPGHDRDRFRAALAAGGIQTSVHYPPIHRFAPYRAHARRALPATEAIADRLVTLPLFPHLSDDDVATVTASVLAEV